MIVLDLKITRGEVAEWLKAHAWKACKGVTLSWVRIPFSPPLKGYISKHIYFIYFFLMKINQQFLQKML